MPHRQVIDAAQIQLGAAIVRNAVTKDPKKIPYMAKGWAIELRKVLVSTVGPQAAAELLKEQAREIEGRAHRRVRTRGERRGTAEKEAGEAR